MKHGYAKRSGRPTEYNIWSNIKARCFKPHCKEFPFYGGRGITLCDKWRYDFTAFLEDMGRRPEGHSIERIDNDGNYEPGNCKWATRKEQANNRRVRRDTTYVWHEGKQVRLIDVAAQHGIPYRRFYNRLYSVLLRGEIPTEAAVAKAVSLGVRSCA